MTNKEIARLRNLIPNKFGKKKADFRFPCDTSRGGFQPFLKEKKPKILIVGSITSSGGTSNGYYYSSSTNQLWSLIDSLFPKSKKTFTAIQQGGSTHKSKDFENLLKGKGILLCDIFKYCFFKPKKGKVSSSDNDIIWPIRGQGTIVAYFDQEITDVIEANPNIVVAVNGSLTQRVFCHVIKPSTLAKCHYYEVCSPCQRNAVFQNKKRLGAWAKAFNDAGLLSPTYSSVADYIKKNLILIP